ACALLAWLGGGRGWVAAAWVALALWVVTRPLPNGVDGYAMLTRGWSVLLAGAFGAVSAALGARSAFLPRALAAVGVAALVATSAAVHVGGFARVADVVRAEAQRRTDVALDPWAARTAGAAWTATAHRVPDAAARAGDAEVALRALPAAAVEIAPALVAVESLGALALAWALYHRLARSRVGPALAPLAAFRFNDQLVWGLVVGAALAALPTLAALRGVGLNLLVFFGALYALRGLAVFRWALGRHGVELPLGAGVALGFAFPLLGGVLAALLTAAALALGLGDSWGDWRTRAWRSRGRPA
ncbi:MAG TPA: DUF2232 domain-containing protein, partial [Gemmatirosa sp.]